MILHHECGLIIKHGFLDSFKPVCILVKTNTDKKIVRSKNSATVTVVFEADRLAERALLART